MDGFPKAIATIVIWVLSVGMGITSIVFSNGSYTGDTIMMMIFPLIFAMLTTAFIWIGKAMLPWIPPDVIRDDMRSPRRENRDEYEKAKRGAARNESKLDMLLSMMDDDERDAFKETLKRQVLSNMRLSDEGELPAGLDSLLDEEPAQRRRY